MNSRLFFTACTFLLLSAQQVAGQEPTQGQPAATTGSTYAAEKSQREAAARDRAVRSEMDASYRRMQAAVERSRILNSHKPGMALPIVLREEDLTPKERKVLEPAPEDLKTYAEFLRQSGTGIFRLMRVDQQDQRKVVSIDDTTLSGNVLLVGRGAHYSFSQKNHNVGTWCDLAWDHDVFAAGVAGNALGILVELGDVRLEDISLENKALTYLVEFTPAKAEPAAEQQFHQLEEGVSENGFRYGLSAPWKLNTAYALRSISYGRADLLVTFRVVKQDSNNSLIILWKKMKTYPKPMLKKEPKK